ncbi:MAG: sensor histidine kinase [Gemmatimonadota bacterium]
MSDNVLPLPDRRRTPERRRADAARIEPPIARRPEWWNPTESLGRLRRALRSQAERLAELLVAEEPGEGQAGWLDPSTGIEDAWLVLSAVRDAVHMAGAGGAPARRTRELHERLDQEALRLVQDALEAKVTAQRRFLEEVSHDIRSPLNSILFLADALRVEQSGPLSPVQKRQVGVLYAAAVTLVKLVNDLIDFARLGKDHPISVASTAFAVEAVLADVHRLVGPLVEHRKVDLKTLTAPVGIRRGDPQLLSRVLLNLVSNAVRAVDEGGAVSVHVSEPRKGTLRIEVTDDAAGTDVERLRKMLCPGTGGAGETRGWTHGLGLAISARLVEAAGGELTVESLAGDRTCFAVELPFSAV